MIEDIVEIKVKRLGNTAKFPVRAHDDDAGWDLYSNTPDFIIHPGEGACINTGIAIDIPSGYFGLIRDRSGLASLGIFVAGGVIDSGYRGEVRVVVHRKDECGPIDMVIERGDRIAQLLILPVPEVKWVEVDELDETDRGTNGFGSTGR